MNANLQKAIDSLHIHDVYLKSSIAQCKNDFEPKYDENLEELNTQTKHIVKETQIVKLNNTDLLVRIFIEFGVRLVDSKITNEDESIRALIEAVFIAEYKLDTEIEQVCIDEYSLKNSSYHVWPYWREFLMSQCNRMYLPRMVLPTMQLAHNRHRE
jgi:hypothetical protein